jgi:hypothetical protein
VSKAAYDVFSVANAVDSLLSVHGGCGHWDAAYGFWMLAGGPAGLLGRLGGGGSGQFGESVACCLLAGHGGGWLSACSQGAGALLRSERHNKRPKLWGLERGGRLLFGFWLEVEPSHEVAFGAVVPLQPADKTISFRYPFPATCTNAHLRIPHRGCQGNERL